MLLEEVLNSLQKKGLAPFVISESACVISESACVNAKIHRTGRTESSLRPREGAWSYSQVCRIHSAIPSSGIMTKSRLHLAGPTSTKTGILIHLFAAQHMEGGFG